MARRKPRKSVAPNKRKAYIDNKRIEREMYQIELAVAMSRDEGDLSKMLAGAKPFIDDDEIRMFMALDFDLSEIFEYKCTYEPPEILEYLRKILEEYGIAFPDIEN